MNAGAGGRYEFATWTAKAHGTFEAPWQLRISPVLRHQSGQPFGRTQTTDAGALRYGTVTLLMELDLWLFGALKSGSYCMVVEKPIER
jgi:hypothetical protein